MARHVYEDNRLYHGTTEDSKADIQCFGMDRNRKTGGAAEAYLEEEKKANGSEPAAEFVENTRSHNYMTGNKDTATDYAEWGFIRTAQRYEAGEIPLESVSHPALVRIIGSENDFSLEVDPDDSDDPARHALRTQSSIPPENIMPSKGIGPSSSQPFQAKLEEAGMSVSAEYAGQLLHEVQSDSDDDTFFKKTPGRHAGTP